MVDSQSVKTIEAGGPRGYGAGRKIKGPQASRHGRHLRRRFVLLTRSAEVNSAATANSSAAASL